MPTPALLPATSIVDPANSVHTTNSYRTALNIVPTIVIQPLTISTVTGAAGTITVVMSSTVQLGGDTLLPTSWTIVAPGGGISGTVTQVSYVGATITLTTTGLTNGLTYTLRAPTFGIYRVSDGANISGDTTKTFTSVSTLPTITLIRAIDGNEIDVVFSKPMLESDCLTITNYSIDHGLAVLSVRKISDFTYRITTGDQTAATTYTVTITNVRDQILNPLT